MAKKQNKKKLILPKKTPINDLILFSIHLIISNNEKCDFERLVKECFTIFTDVFGLSRYPHWPDCRKLDRSLRTLRAEKLIKGDPKTIFTLTSEGRQRALEIARTLKQGKLL